MNIYFELLLIGNSSIIAAILEQEQQSQRTLSNNDTFVIGLNDCIILQSFNLPMILSMWILASDILGDFCTFNTGICNFPLECGIVRVAPYVTNSSSILNPLFAKIVSACCNFSMHLFRAFLSVYTRRVSSSSNNILIHLL